VPLRRAPHGIPEPRTPGPARRGINDLSRFVGIDVGARRLHAVALDEGHRVLGAEAFAAGALDELRDWVGDADRVAIDAPDALSTEPHAGDETLSRKFRPARCGEIELGRRCGIWVSWVTPSGPPAPPWMEVGFALHDTLPNTVETYPHAGFRTLAGAGTRLPPKSTAPGRAQRHELLRAAGVELHAGADHHTLDAAVAALAAEPVTCGHDGSAIWLPRAPGAASA
jgi:predicted nuclease with RNAse H fold